MGFIYVIQNNLDKKKYVGQTVRDVSLRFTEHKCSKSEDRLLSSAIKTEGEQNFSIIYVKEIHDKRLTHEEEKLIEKHNSIHPNGYNLKRSINLTTLQNSKGGKSESGHDKQSKKVKERYKLNPKLKDFDVPRGISYYSRMKNGKLSEGFKVRKVGIKSKQFMSLESKKLLHDNLNKAKAYLESQLNAQRLNINE